MLKSIDFKNKMLIYSSMLFMGALLIITLTVLGVYGLKSNDLETKNNKTIVLKDKQIKELQSQNQLLQQELSTLKGKTAIKNK